MTGRISSMHHRWLFGILFFEFILMGFSGVWYSGLTGDAFFSPGVDPSQWFFFLCRWPQYILSIPPMAWLVSLLMLAGLVRLFLKPGDHITARIMLLLFWAYYATLTAYLGHRNFQSGMIFLFFPFIFREGEGRRLAWEAARYFLLFFYVSAALFKVTHEGMFDIRHMSHILSGQLAPYYAEQPGGFRLAVNQFLVTHPLLSQALFWVSVLIEWIPLGGLFTRKWDRQIAVLLIGFHLVNWFLMDIAPIGQMAFICLLFCKTASEKSV